MLRCFYRITQDAAPQLTSSGVNEALDMGQVQPWVGLGHILLATLLVVLSFPLNEL